MINKNSCQHFEKTLVVFLTIIFLLGYANSTIYGVLFPDYFPLDPAVHGLKTFQYTYGETGTFQSYISGTLTVPYTSGPIEGAGIVNLSDMDILYANNNGSEVKWIGTDDGYISTDPNLTAHPDAWTFSTVTDDMFLDQGVYYMVDPDLHLWVMEYELSLLFDIQNVTVSTVHYTDAVIIWYLDEEHSFTALDFGGKDIDLGIILPNSTQTGNYSVKNLIRHLLSLKNWKKNYLKNLCFHYLLNYKN